MGSWKENVWLWVGVGVGVAVLALLLFIGVMIGVSAKRLSTTEIGLAYDVNQHVLSETVQGEGLHFDTPGFRFVSFPATFTSIDFNGLNCLNNDGVQITLDVSFQYRPLRSRIYALALQFQNSSMYEDVVRSTGESIIHIACSMFNTTEFQTARTQFENTVRNIMDMRMETFFTNISDVQIQNIQRPSAFETAVRNKETARENVNVATNMRLQRETEATTVLRQAETNATITIDRALSDQRIALTQAMTEAMAVLDEFEREAETYATIMATQGLTVQGLLAYLSTRAIGEARETVLANVNRPAKDSYSNEL